MAGPYVAAAITATALFGLAAVALKEGVSRGLPTLSFGEVVRRPLAVALKLLRNRIWLAGLALNVVGGLLYFVALARLDLTIVKPIITFYVVVAAVLGATLLKERIAGIEVAGIAVAVGGAAMLGLQGEAVTGDAVPLVEQVHGMWLVTGIAAVLSVVAAAPLWFAPMGRLVSREASMSAVSGVTWGLGAAWYKLFANQMLEFESVLEAGGVVAAAGTGAFYADALAAPALWLMLALNAFGFVVYQLAFANGRVAVVAPVVMTATLVAPLIAGGWVYGEDLPALKVAGIVTAAAGTVILTLGKREGAEPPGAA